MLVYGLAEVEDAQEEISGAAAEGEKESLLPVRLSSLGAHGGTAVGGVEYEAAVGVQLPQAAVVGQPSCPLHLDAETTDVFLLLRLPPPPLGLLQPQQVEGLEPLLGYVLGQQDVVPARLLGLAERLDDDGGREVDQEEARED